MWMKIAQISRIEGQVICYIADRTPSQPTEGAIQHVYGDLKSIESDNSHDGHPKQLKNTINKSVKYEHIDIIMIIIIITGIIMIIMCSSSLFQLHSFGCNLVGLIEKLSK